MAWVRVTVASFFFFFFFLLLFVIILLKVAIFFFFFIVTSLSFSCFCFHILPLYCQTKWCPAPGCEHAVLFDAGNGNYDVSCLCTYGFCWKVGITNISKIIILAFIIILCTYLTFLLNLQCTEEAHRPVDCATVEKWILKNSAESENMNWYFFGHSLSSLIFAILLEDFKVKFVWPFFPLQLMLAFLESSSHVLFLCILIVPSVVLVQDIEHD